MKVYLIHRIYSAKLIALSGILLILSPSINAQSTGVSKKNPGRDLDVAGNLRIRNLNNNDMQDKGSVMAYVPESGAFLLKKVEPYNLMLSSGLWRFGFTATGQVKTVPGLLTGKKAARLDFTLRIATNGTDFSFAMFYVPGKKILVLQQPVGGPDPVNLITSDVSDPTVGVDKFIIRAQNGSDFRISFTSPNSAGVVNMIFDPGSSWINGMVKSVPILD